MTIIVPRPDAPGRGPSALLRARARQRRPLVAPTQRRAPKPPPSVRVRLLTATMLTVGVALLTFVAYLGFISGLKHDRAQHLAYADFRKQLALGTAPTGPTDPNNPSKLLTPGSPVALLSIPQIHVSEVVFEGTTSSVLQKGPGHLRDSVLPGQAGTSVLFGRATAFGGPFGHINQLQPGDLFTVTTGQGVQRYAVLDVRRAGDELPPAPATGSDRLVLDTADGAPLLPGDVLRVDADLVSKLQATPTQVVTSGDLLPSETALATDGTAWIDVVLWSQGLVLAALLLAFARAQWGRRQAWVVAVPVIGFFALGVADAASRLLPNLT